MSISSGDIALNINSAQFTDNLLDLLVSDNDLKTDDGLLTAVLLSVYTDKLVSIDELPEGEKSKRGWWGDLFASNEGDLIGSKLWLLNRSKNIQETLNSAEEYVEEALQWMIDDSICESIFVTASFDVNNFLRIVIEIDRGTLNQSVKYDLKWNTEEVRTS